MGAGGFHPAGHYIYWRTVLQEWTNRLHLFAALPLTNTTFKPVVGLPATIFGPPKTSSEWPVFMHHPTLIAVDNAVSAPLPESPKIEPA